MSKKTSKQKTGKKDLNSEHLEKALQGPQISSHRLLNNFPGLVYQCREDTHRTMEFLGDGSIDLLGYKPSDLIQNNKVSYATLIHPDDRDYVLSEIQNANRDKRTYRIEYRITAASGKQKWVCEQGQGMYSPKGDLIALEGFVTDISDYRAFQDKTERLNLVLRTIRNVNRLLVKEKDPIKLLRGICDNLVENRGYFNTWIALFDVSGVLTHIAESGLGEQLSPLIERIQKGELPGCMRNIFKKSASQIIEDPASTCSDCPLSQNYAGRGGITTRLRYGGRTYGVLSASIPKHFVTDSKEKELFEEVAGDIAYALHEIELNKQYKKAQEEIRLTSTYPEENPYPVFRVKHDGTIAYANEGSRRVLEKWKRHSGERVPGDWLKIVHRVLESGVSEEMEVLIGDKNFFFSIVPVDGDQYVNIYGLDITKLRRTETALEKSERRFQDLVENCLVGIGIIQNGKVVFRNPEQERLLGPVVKGAGGSAFDHVYKDDAEKVEKALRKIMTGKQRFVDMDFRICSPETKESQDKFTWVHCRACLIEHHGREALLLNMTDVSQTKELENLLRIQDKMASLGRVAAGIAHEIRNPLSGINIYLDTLVTIYDKQDSQEKVLSILERAKSASDKIESVIRRVMDFAKPGTLNLVQENVNKPIEEAIKLASVTLRKRGVLLQKNLSLNLPRCRIDLQMIEGVILNLITNATEAMKNIERSKKIRISSYVKNNNIYVAVSDAGPGINAELQDKIFDPFYTTKNGSTGIGLSLSQRIIADHGGSMSVSNSRLGGARFTIEMPIEHGKKEK
jgi:PAS domain S-box-containing protein